MFWPPPLPHLISCPRSYWMAPYLIQGPQYHGCWNWRENCPPRFWRSSYPYFNQGDRLYPPHYYWPLLIFRPSYGPGMVGYLYWLPSTVQCRFLFQFDSFSTCEFKVQAQFLKSGLIFFHSSEKLWFIFDANVQRWLDLRKVFTLAPIPQKGVYSQPWATSL